jgi:putative colanic acid biosynthesis UDP-glucose lipid carrier transferase
MKPKSRFFYFLRDFLTFGFAFFVSLYFFKDAKLSRQQWLLFFYLMVIFFIIEFLKKPERTNLSRFRERFFNHVKSYTIFTALLVVAYFVIPIKWHHGGRFLAILTGICVLDFMLNYILVEVIQRVRNAYDVKHIVVAGTGMMAKNVERKLFEQHEHLYDLKGFINCDNNEEPVIGEERVLGDLQNIDQYLMVNTVDEIVIAMPSTCTKEIQNVLSIADYHGVRVKYIIDYQEIFGQHYKITRFGDVDAVNIRQLPADNLYAAFCKNCFDKVFSFFVLLFLAPIFLVIAILIKIDSPGPVFYYPIRIGRGGKPFKLYKFRTMIENDATSGGTLIHPGQ